MAGYCLLMERERERDVTMTTDRPTMTPPSHTHTLSTCMYCSYSVHCVVMLLVRENRSLVTTDDLNESLNTLSPDWWA